jgi:Fe-S oxidoreductase
VEENKLDELKSFGVKKYEDFTWKHMLDFYSCADCGRCSDQCPANAVKRPLSPRFISIKCRDYAFKNYPIRGEMTPKDEHLIGTILSEDEIWSCTTCGACEAECPIFIEYIDKIVDLRRGMVDEGLVPQSLQKPLKALEKRGNPWGKMEKKRAEWTKTLPETCDVKLFENGDEAQTLYFVDSITSYDDRMQNIARATACVLSACGEDFGILGKDEKDSGNEIRRFGEEMLFQDIKSHNTEAILGAGVTKIIASDPHAFNTLKNEYTGLPPVEHISQTLTRSIRDGKIRLKPVEDLTRVYAYHDPCYLGRHNGIYEDPREALDAIPGLRRVDMLKSRDRSFCCGGGLMLFYEPEEEQRMGVLRVQMASKAGANVIVTACPFCLVNMEDAIKVAGLEGKMEAIQIRDNVGGSVTVVTVGDADAEEILRREMAMGADKGVLLSDDAFNGSDGKGIAAILKAEVAKGKYDLILTGAQADDGAAQVGGMLAAMSRAILPRSTEFPPIHVMAVMGMRFSSIHWPAS